jgi:hypothetical protein
VELPEELELELSDELLSGGGPPLLLLGVKLPLECEEFDDDSKLELLLSLDELLVLALDSLVLLELVCDELLELDELL